MRQKPVVIMYILLSLFLAVPSGAPPPPVTHTAEGVVRDAQGRVLSGVVVAIEDSITSYIVVRRRFEMLRDGYHARKSNAQFRCSDWVTFTDSLGQYCLVLPGENADVIFYKPSFRLARLSYPRDTMPDSCECFCPMMDLEMELQTYLGR
jgi:hypothetical protein